MPRTLPAGTAAWLAKQGGNAMPVVLADIQTGDGTQYFWSDYEGAYPTKFTGANQLYNGWIKNGFSFTRTRDLSTNAGDLVVQNLSGNTIVRDVSNALDTHEFEGALCIIRLWLPLFDQAMDEFHCSLSEPSPSEDECSFRMLTLLDPSQYFCADIAQGELCPWRYKSAQCGSAGAAATCDFKFTTCSDANHLAQERFSGILATVPGNIFQQPVKTGRGGDGGDDGPVHGGGGPGRRIIR
jgi:phage-related protein